MSTKRGGTAASIVNKAKNIAVQDASKAQALLSDAVKSQAYLYPIKGIYYFVSHKDLWKPLLDQLVPTLSTAVGVTAFMFVFTYLPQVAVLTLVNGPLAVLSTILLVFSESATITNIVTRAFFIEDKLLDTFDATLLACDQSNLVSHGRELKPRSSSSNVVSRLGKMASKPFARFTPTALLRYLMYLPLNAIPIVGTLLFIILQGRKFGPAAHARYFQLKSMNRWDKEEWIADRRAAYTGFGIPAVLLEMVPFVGIFFAFTNTVGAALWAADIEAGRAPHEGGSAPHEGGSSHEDELPPQETGVVRVPGKKEL